LKFSDHRLPPGRHGLSPDFVAEHQRWRLIGAAAEMLHECGYAGVSARGIAVRAAVSSSTFYRHFDNVTAVLTASFEAAALTFLEVVSEACRSAGEGEPRSLATLQAALAFVAEDPDLARLMGNEAAAAVAEIAAGRQDLLDRLAEMAAASAGADLPGCRCAFAGALALIASGERAPGGAPELVEILTAVGMS